MGGRHEAGQGKRKHRVGKSIGQVGLSVSSERWVDLAQKLTNPSSQEVVDLPNCRAFACETARHRAPSRSGQSSCYCCVSLSQLSKAPPMSQQICQGNSPITWTMPYVDCNTVAKRKGWADVISARSTGRNANPQWSASELQSKRPNKTWHGLVKTNITDRKHQGNFRL